MVQKRSRKFKSAYKQNKTSAALLVVASLIALGIGSRWLTTYLASPIAGALSGAHVLGLRSALDMTPATIDDGYASFTYPKGLIAVSPSPNVSPVVAAYKLRYHHAPQTWNLAVSIIHITSGRLADNNAYQFRRLHPQTYEESSQTFKGTPVVVMTDKTAVGFSQVGFLVNGEYQAAVSLYGDDQAGTASLQATFAMVLDSWRWHEQ